MRIDVGLVLALSIGLGVAMLSAGDGLLSQCEELDSLLIEPRAWTPSGVVVRLAAPSGFSGCLHVVCTTNLSQTGWQLVHTTNVVGGGVVEWLDAAATNGDVAARFYELWNGDVDADHDGLSDCREARLFGTQRDNPDSDGDGIPDGAEVDEGSDPADAGSGLPSDPADAAPALPKTVVSEFSQANTFLVTGADATQRGVAEDAIQPYRMAVLRGRTLNAAGAPLPGVQVTILNHPEYGSTRSRADGGYDLLVNGGAPVAVVFERYDRLTVHRRVDVPWRQFVVVPDVRLITVDPHVTTILLGASGTVHVARGSVGVDADGARQPTLMIPGGVTATVVRASGQTQTVDRLNVRLTEFTLGEGGPEAMPAPLPPTARYTHCVELSVDGAREVTFDKPVYYYLDNFLGFAVGAVIPQGHYNTARGVWEPTPDGIVLGIVAVNGDGLAELDSDGDGAAETQDALDALGLTDAERRNIAALYAPGSSIWRVPVRHFSRKDHNWPVIAEAGSAPPAMPPPTEGKTTGGEKKLTGGAIDVENRRFIESLPLVGCPFELHYASDRVPGREAQLQIPLTGDTLQGRILDIIVEVSIAGQLFRTNFAPRTNLTYVHHWDGRDVYGRRLNGKQWASVRVGYMYQGYYGDTVGGMPDQYGGGQAAAAEAQSGGDGLAGSFGRPSGYIAPGDVATREYITCWQQSYVLVGTIDARGVFGLGGWSLGVHHVYDPEGNILHYGTGDDRPIRAQAFSAIVTTVAGSGVQDYLGSGDGGDARAATLYEPQGLACAADGSYYIADVFNNRIRRVDPAGIITTVAGTGLAGYGGDGGPATNAWLCRPQGVAVSADGEVYVADRLNNRVRVIHPSGTIDTFAGTGATRFSGDGGPATNAAVWGPAAVAVAPDGDVYIADADNMRVRCVGTDGIIRTIAGGGTNRFGGAAIESSIGPPRGVTVGPDGSVFVAETDTHQISRITPDGMIRLFAGCGARGYGGDNGPATNAAVEFPAAMAVGPDGSLYITDRFYNRVRRVTPDGIIARLAGTGAKAYGGDGGPALRATFSWPQAIAVTPGGDLLVADSANNRIRRIALPTSAYETEELVIPSEDGAVVYCFDRDGRHLATRDAITWRTLLTFGYTDAGLLDRIVDADGLETTIERLPDGRPIALCGSFGHRTLLQLDDAGWLVEVVNPAAETNELGYGDAGLLTNIVSRRGYTFTTDYSDDGTVAGTRDPVGGSQRIACEFTGDGARVTCVSAMGRTNVSVTATLSDLAFTRITTNAAGLSVRYTRSPNGEETTTLPDGTSILIARVADPRLGGLASYIGTRALRLPDGREFTASATREAELTTPGDPRSLVTATSTHTREGHTTRVVYAASNRTATVTTPSGRTSVSRFDAVGRPLVTEAPGLFAVSNVYDRAGRLARVCQGEGAQVRVVSFVYAADGTLAAITNAAGKVTRFAADDAGRATNAVRADGGVIACGYDRSETPVWYRLAHATEHRFETTPIGLPAAYRPPDAGAQQGRIAYTHNADRQPTSVSVAGGMAMTNHYDAAGRVTSVCAVAYGATNTIAYNYDAAGRLTEASRDGFALRFTYAGVLPASQYWGSRTGEATEYRVDASLRLEAVGVGGRWVSRRYDADSLLTLAGDLVLQRAADTGFVTNTVLGTVAEQRAYTGFGELAETATTIGGSNVLALSYRYDVSGRITNRIERMAGVTVVHGYGYDALGRLTTETSNGVERARYAYDANGNRTNAVTGGVMCRGRYDNQDRQHVYGATTNSWCGDGTLTNRIAAGRQTQFGYDGFGDLREVTLDDGRAITYKYDALGRRIEKWCDGELVARWTYRDGLNPLSEWNRYGYIVKQFVYGDHPFVPSYMIQAGVTYRFITDQVGSVRLVIDTQTGTIAQQLDYDAFGVILRDTNPGFQPFGFQGGLHDPATGLTRFGARDYDPATGRWLTKDPILLAGGLNVYAFCGNDPVNFVDPWGEYTYRVNRKIGGRTARSRINPLTHTFYAVVEADGTIHTYSWGNTYNEQKEGLWVRDAEEDRIATQEALASKRAIPVGDETLDPYIAIAFAELKKAAESRHRWRVWSNCKHEAEKLKELAMEYRSTGVPPK